MEDLQLQEMKKKWQERQEKKEQAKKKRREDALYKANAVTVFLKEKYGVKKVYLFGSLSRGKHFSAHSDIDILLEGFPQKEKVWEALARAEHIAAPFPLSLILAEDAFPDFAQKAKEEGIVL